MATVRKVQSKVVKAPERVEAAPQAEEARSRPSRDRSDGEQSGSVVKAAARVKKCAFCTSKTEPMYWDAAALRKFISDRGRIVPRSRSGACAKHQRRVSKQIKYARHLSLLPFMVRA